MCVCVRVWGKAEKQLVKLVVKRVNVRPCAHVHGYLFKYTFFGLWLELKQFFKIIMSTFNSTDSQAHAKPRGDAVTTKHKDTLATQEPEGK